MARRHRPPPTLKRKIGSRRPRAKIIVVSEGRLTEPSYFYAMARHCRALVDLKGGAGVPLSVVDSAIELVVQRGREADSFGKDDQIWAVFDRDAHPHFMDAINKAEAAGVLVAYSNPCFELWLVLHYRDNDGPITRHQIQRALRALMPGYHPSRAKGVAFGDICDCVHDAEQRAEKMERRRKEEKNARGNPSTTVFKLTKEIRKLGAK